MDCIILFNANIILELYYSTVQDNTNISPSTWFLHINTAPFKGHTNPVVQMRRLTKRTMSSSLPSPRPQDQAFCSKVHNKLNKVSTASAAALDFQEDNHLRLTLVNGRIIR